MKLRLSKPRPNKTLVKEMVKGKTKDSWTKNGTKDRYAEIFEYRLERHPFEFLERAGIKNPKVIFIGPGKGEYISNFKEEANKRGIFPVIEVIGITKTVNPELITNGTISKDHSMGLTLENIFDNPKKHNSVIREISDSSNLVIASKSSGFHTFYPAYNVFISALFLKSGGRTYIEIPSKELILGSESKRSREPPKTFSFLTKLKQMITGEEDSKNQIPFKHKKRIIYELQNIEEEAKKYLDNYFKRDTSKEFKISTFFRSKNVGSVFIMVDRK